MKTTGLTVALLILVAATALAQVPRTINYQGRARSNNQPVTGTHTMTLKIYDAESGGNELYSETHPAVQFTGDGIFTVAIGDSPSNPDGLPDYLTFAQPYWIGVTISGINGDQELTPRLTLRSTPYSLRAQVADSAAVIPAHINGHNADGSLLSIDNSNGSIGLEVNGGDYGLVSYGSVKTDGYFISENTVGDDDAPQSGGVYYDNVPIAWAQIDAQGRIIADFGVASVTKQTGINGTYDILLDNGVVMTNKAPAMAPVVTPYNSNTDIPATFVAGMWIYKRDATSGNYSNKSFTVQMRSSNGPVDFGFTLIVMGRPE
jgi:hypothetical protein